MSGARITIGVLAAAAIQTLLSRLVPQIGERIDFFLIFVAADARTGSRSGAIGAGALAGGIEDALSGGLFGLNGFAKTLVGYLLSLLAGRVLVDHPASIALTISAGVAVSSAICALLRFLLAQPATGTDVSSFFLRVLLTGGAGVAAAAFARYPWRERWRIFRMRRLRD